MAHEHSHSPLVPHSHDAADSIDAALVNLSVALNYEQRGDGRILLRFGDLMKDFHVHVIFATDKAIAGRPQALRGFLAGWFNTIAFMRKDKAKTVEIAQEVMQTDPPTTSRIYDEMMPMFNDDGHFKPPALAVLSRSTSLGCSPTDGSSSTYSM